MSELFTRFGFACCHSVAFVILLASQALFITVYVAEGATLSAALIAIIVAVVVPVQLFDMKRKNVPFTVRSVALSPLFWVQEVWRAPNLVDENMILVDDFVARLRDHPHSTVAQDMADGLQVGRPFLREFGTYSCPFDCCPLAPTVSLATFNTGMACTVVHLLKLFFGPSPHPDWLLASWCCALLGIALSSYTSADFFCVRLQALRVALLGLDVVLLLSLVRAVWESGEPWRVMYSPDTAARTLVRVACASLIAKQRVGSWCDERVWSWRTAVSLMPRSRKTAVIALLVSIVVSFTFCVALALCFLFPFSWCVAVFGGSLEDVEFDVAIWRYFTRRASAEKMTEWPSLGDESRGEWIELPGLTQLREESIRTRAALVALSAPPDAIVEPFTTANHCEDALSSAYDNVTALQLQWLFAANRWRYAWRALRTGSLRERLHLAIAVAMTAMVLCGVNDVIDFSFRGRNLAWWATVFFFVVVVWMFPGAVAELRRIHLADWVLSGSWTCCTSLAVPVVTASAPPAASTTTEERELIPVAALWLAEASVPRVTDVLFPVIAQRSIPHAVVASHLAHWFRPVDVLKGVDLAVSDLTAP